MIDIWLKLKRIFKMKLIMDPLLCKMIIKITLRIRINAVDILR